MPAASKAQQRFFGMVRATQKGEMKNPSSEILDVADDISVKDAKKFAKTKHKGLPEKKKMKEQFEIDKSAHKKAQKKSKMRNLAIGNENPNEKAAAEKKAGGPKLYGEEDNYSTKDSELKRTKKPRDQRYKTLHKATDDSGNIDVNEDLTSYKTFIKNAEDSRDKVKKKTDERKKKDAAYVDRVKKGIKFYDKKGKGHIRGGKKVYD